MYILSPTSGFMVSPQVMVSVDLKALVASYLDGFDAMSQLWCVLSIFITLVAWVFYLVDETNETLRKPSYFPYSLTCRL